MPRKLPQTSPCLFRDLLGPSYDGYYREDNGRVDFNTCRIEETDWQGSTQYAGLSKIIGDYSEHVPEQFAKKLLGNSEIETILKRLDRLTREEAHVTVAQTLAIVHGLLNNMKVVIDGGWR
jgi:hypothetical protein